MRSARSWSARVVTSAVLALVVAGCAARRDSADPPAEVSATPTSAAQPATELVRMTGAVVGGAEPGCYLLDTGFTRYVLIGGSPADLTLALETGEQVTVTGQAHSPTPTPCTEGIPLEIQDIVPAT